MKRSCPTLSLPLALLALLIAPIAAAQRAADAPRLVADVYPGAESSDKGYGGFASDGKKVFFIAEDGVHGNQVWFFDAAARKPAMLTRAGFISDNAGSLWLGGNRLYFFYRDAEHGCELWSMESGKPGSERMLVDAAPGPQDCGFFFFQAIGSNVVFALTNRVTQQNVLYISDGTPEGTRLFHEDSPSWFEPLGMSNGLFYYVYNAHSPGAEIWRSDGTTSGTIRLKKLNMGASIGYHETVRVGSATYLLVRNEGDAFHWQDQFWKSDGTSSTTVQVTALPAGFINSIHHLVSFRGRLYFIALSAAGDYRLYLYVEKPGGASAETVEVARFPGTGLAEPFLHLEVCEGQILLFALHGVWRSDATAEGTMLLKKLNVLFPSYGALTNRPLAEAHGCELIKIPGRDRWVFAAAPPGSTANDLWWTEGAPAGVFPLADLGDSEWGSYPTDLLICGQNLFFSNDDPDHGREPWMMPLGRLFTAARGWAAYR